MVGRVIAAWPSFALTASYELLTRQIRASAATHVGGNFRARHASARLHASRREARDGIARRFPGLHWFSSTLPGRSWARSCSGRHGNGPWPTGPMMAACPAASRSLTATAATNAGADSSNTQVAQASSVTTRENRRRASQPLAAQADAQTVAGQRVHSMGQASLSGWFRALGQLGCEGLAGVMGCVESVGRAVEAWHLSSRLFPAGSRMNTA